MKRISIGLFISFLFLLIFSACKENVYVDWKLANENWYAVHKSDSGFVTSSTGLCYKIIYPGWSLSRQPNSGSSVEVTYKGTLIDGSVFDSETSAVWFTLSGTIEGWQEIMPKLHNGARVKMYVPAALAYDTISTNSSIPPHSVLIFDINLIDSSN
jgi:FKBP-type peptidyl-prolyl cis-trans isomerase FkpA